MNRDGHPVQPELGEPPVTARQEKPDPKNPELFNREPPGFSGSRLNRRTWCPSLFMKIKLKNPEYSC